MNEMTGFWDRHQGVESIDPIPCSVEAGLEEIGILEPVDLQRITLNSWRRFVGEFVRWARIIGFVVVEHRLKVGSLERFNIRLSSLGLGDPGSEPFRRETLGGVGFLEIPRVLRVGLLLRIRREFASETVGMREVKDNELFGSLGLRHRKGPRDHAPPVVSKNRGFLDFLVIEHREDIAHKFFESVVFDPLGLPA